MTVVVADDDMPRWVIGTLEQAHLSLPIGEHKCPHCCLPIRYPLVVGADGVNMVRDFMSAIDEVATRHGITANLVADVTTELLLQVIRRSAGSNGGGAE